MNAEVDTLFRHNLRDKLIAFSIHLGASLPVYIALLLLVRFVWYPDFYYELLKVQPILIILFVVDVVLGPLSTFVVFKKYKPRLKFDIGAIVTFQLVAFLYGASVVYNERPLYLVYAIDRFVVVTANSIDTDYIVYPELKINLPQVVGTNLPEENSEKEAVLFGSLNGGPDIEHLPYLYRPISNVKKLLKENGIKIEAMPNDVVSIIIDKYPEIDRLKIMTYPLIPMKSRDQLLLWDIENNQLVGLVDQNPWVINAKDRVKPENDN